MQGLAQGRGPKKIPIDANVKQIFRSKLGIFLYYKEHGWASSYDSESFCIGAGRGRSGRVSTDTLPNMGRGFGPPTHVCSLVQGPALKFRCYMGYQNFAKSCTPAI